MKIFALLLLSASCCSIVGAAQAEEVEAKPADPYGLNTNLDDLDGADQQQDITSRFEGPRKKWEFDTGYFDFDDRQSGVLLPGDTSQDYSGFRIRRKGKP